MDDRFVARRGSQGDEWRWESQPPPEPGHDQPPGPSRSSHWLAALSHLAGRSRAWVRSGIALGGSLPRRMTERRAKNGLAQESVTPPGEPEAVSEAPPSLADTESAPTPREPWSRRTSRPRVEVPWSRSAGARPRLALPSPSQIPDDVRAPLVLASSIVLAAAIVIGTVVAVDAIGDGGTNGGIVGGVTQTPRPSTTLIPPETSTPRPSATPSPTRRSPTASATPAMPTPNGPQGTVALALWANDQNSWWFGDLGGDVANYEEGDNVPLMLQFEGVAGQTYWVRIVYDCSAAGATGAIDYLSGVQNWGRGIVFANDGPAQERPNGAITVPDTPAFVADDANPGLFTVYGAKFPVLPLPPAPGGGCPGQRTMSLPVQAYGGRIALIASAHLAAAAGHGTGAGSATARIVVRVSVDGLGEAGLSIDPTAVSP